MARTLNRRLRSRSDLALSLLPWAQLCGNTIVLTNGDRLTGKVQGLDDGKFTVALSYTDDPGWQQTQGQTPTSQYSGASTSPASRGYGGQAQSSGSRPSAGLVEEFGNPGRRVPMIRQAAASVAGGGWRK